MANVTFKEVNPSDPDEYIFQDSTGVCYALYTDARGRGVKGVNPDFWDKFFSCKKIVIDYSTSGDKRNISKIISYK